MTGGQSAFYPAPEGGEGHTKSVTGRILANEKSAPRDPLPSPQETENEAGTKNGCTSSHSAFRLQVPDHDSGDVTNMPGLLPAHSAQ